MSDASNKQYNLHFKNAKKKVNVLSEVSLWVEENCLKYSYFPFSDIILFFLIKLGLKTES